MNKEIDSVVFSALCILCMIIPCCQVGRKGGRKERGGNWKKSLPRQSEVTCSGFRKLTADWRREQHFILWEIFFGLYLAKLLLDRWTNPVCGGGIYDKSLCFQIMPRLPVMGWAEHPPTVRKHNCQCAQTEKLPEISLLLLWLNFFIFQIFCCIDSFFTQRAVPRPAPACWTDVWGMASAVFEGTSLVNMFVRDCWVNGIRRLIISQRGEEEEFFEIRTEWSDRNILYLHRSYSDLGRLFRRLLESFPEDIRDLSKSPLIEGWSDGNGIVVWQEVII